MPPFHLKRLHLKPTLSTPNLLRPRLFTTTSLRLAEGDTGAPRSHADAWTKREQAAENLYIREHEKTIIKQLKEKIAAQEAILRKDRQMLQVMEDGYGRVQEEKR